MTDRRPGSTAPGAAALRLRPRRGDDQPGRGSEHRAAGQARRRGPPHRGPQRAGSPGSAPAGGYAAGAPQRASPAACPRPHRRPAARGWQHRAALRDDGGREPARLGHPARPARRDRRPPGRDSTLGQPRPRAAPTGLRPAAPHGRPPCRNSVALDTPSSSAMPRMSSRLPLWTQRRRAARSDPGALPAASPGSQRGVAAESGCRLAWHYELRHSRVPRLRLALRCRRRS